MLLQHSEFARGFKSIRRKKKQRGLGKVENRCVGCRETKAWDSEFSFSKGFLQERFSDQRFGFVHVVSARPPVVNLVLTRLAARKTRRGVKNPRKPQDPTLRWTAITRLIIRKYDRDSFIFGHLASNFAPFRIAQKFCKKGS